MEILSFLAANPTQKYTLTELARGLEVNPSSMHGILAVMTQSGFLERHPSHKTYNLGPMAAAVGHAAYGQNPQIELARSELSRIANQRGLKSAIVAVIDGTMVTLGRDGPLTGQHLTFVGQQEPHTPPYGSVFVAWGAPQAAQQWLARSRVPLSPSSIDQYHYALAAIREDGRAILVAEERQLRFALSSVPPAMGGDLLVPLEEIGSMHVHYIGVPIFDAFGAVSLGLFVDEFSPRVDLKEIKDLADRLQGAARNVMTRTGGQPPAP